MARTAKNAAAPTLIKAIAIATAGIVIVKTGDFMCGLIVFFIVLLALAALLILWRFLKPAKRRSLQEIDTMNGHDFEAYLAELFKRHGYKAKVTSASGDYGADLILQKDGERIVVQAKRYKNNVGIRAVQEVIPAIAYYKADCAWVVTNSYLTKQAERLAEANDVVVIDRDELIKWL